MTEFEESVMMDAAAHYVKCLLEQSAFQVQAGASLQDAINSIYNTMRREPEANMDIVVKFWKDKGIHPVGDSQMIH